MTGSVAWAMLRADRLRSVLVLLLAGIPALLIGAVAVVVPSVRNSQLPVMRLQYGSSGVALCDPQGFATAEEITRYAHNVVPAGSRVVALNPKGGELVHVGDRSLLAQVTESDFTSSVISPRLRLLLGRLPAHTGDGALSPAAAHALHAHLGDTVALLGTHVRVVGLVRDRTNWNGRSVLIGLGTLHDRQGLLTLVGLPHGKSLAHLPSSGALPCGYSAAVNGNGVFHLSGKNPPPATFGVLVTGCLLILALGSLTVATALKVTARRSLEDLRLLRENGATARRLRAVLRRQGVILGAAAGTVGVGLGLVAGRLSIPVVQRYNDWEISHVGADARLVAASFAMAVACAVLGAAIAARSTVGACLTTERDAAPQRRHPLRPVMGVILLAAGGSAVCWGVGEYSRNRGVLSSILTGALVMVGGVALVSPLVTTVWARVAGWGRNLDAIVARQVAVRSGRGPYALAAVACAIAASVGTTIHAAAAARENAQRAAGARGLPADEVRLSYFQDTREVTPADTATVTAGFTVVRTATVASAQPYYLDLRLPGGALAADDGSSSIVACDRPGLFELLGVSGDTTAARAALARGEVVVNAAAHQSTQVFRLPDYIGDVAQGPPEPQATKQFTGLRWQETGQLPAAIVAACPKPLERNPHVVVRLNHVPTEHELAILDRRAQSLDAVLEVGAPTTPDDSFARTLAFILAATAGLFAALVTVVATALSTLDARDDEALLHEAGAPRRTRRELRALRALTISGQGIALGAVIGTAVGIGTCLAQGYRPAVFWSAALLLALTPPVLAAMAALLPLKRTPLT